MIVGNVWNCSWFSINVTSCSAAIYEFRECLGQALTANKYRRKIATVWIIIVFPGEKQRVTSKAQTSRAQRSCLNARQVQVCVCLFFKIIFFNSRFCSCTRGWIKPPTQWNTGCCGPTPAQLCCHVALGSFKAPEGWPCSLINIQTK